MSNDPLYAKVFKSESLLKSFLSRFGLIFMPMMPFYRDSYVCLCLRIFSLEQCEDSWWCLLENLFTYAHVCTFWKMTENASHIIVEEKTHLFFKLAQINGNKGSKSFLENFFRKWKKLTPIFTAYNTKEVLIFHFLCVFTIFRRKLDFFSWRENCEMSIIYERRRSESLPMKAYALDIKNGA